MRNHCVIEELIKMRIEGLSRDTTSHGKKVPILQPLSQLARLLFFESFALASPNPL